MKKKVGLISLMLSVCIAGTMLGGCGGKSSSSQSSEKKVTLKYAELNPDNHPMTIAANEFAKIVKDKSKGRIEIKVYPSGQLGDEKTQIQGVQMGAIDFMRANAVSLGDYGVKKMNLFALPFVFRDRDHIWKVLDGSIGNEIMDSVQTSGTKMVGVGWMEEGSRNFFFRSKEVKTVADMKGLKIRVPQTQILMDTVAAFGASPTPISYSELYSSLQTGVVDGAENPPTGYVANNYTEVCKYYTLDSHVYSPSVIVMSEAKWNKLSPEDQKILKEAMKEVEKFNRASAEKADNEALAAAKKAGVTITEVPNKAEWQNAVKPLYEKYGAEFKALLDSIISTK